MLETIQTCKQSLSNQVLIHSWVETVHMQVKCLAQGHSATSWQPIPMPKTSQSNVAGHSLCAMTPCMYMEYTFGCRDTEGGHYQGACRPQWFFYAHSKSVRQLHRLHGHASHETCTVSNVEGQERFHKFYLSGTPTPNCQLGQRTPLPTRLLRHFCSEYLEFAQSKHPTQAPHFWCLNFS